MFHVLHSSAGAGKTHALVKHYLTLALASEDPSAYARILALTFTNKAAAEMRERILRYLEGLRGAEALTPAIADVRATLIAEGVPAEVVGPRAAKVLTHMLHHWPQLAVSTIDAFTRRVVMPFARDLRLDSELRMTTEEQDYRDMAVERLLEEAGSDAPLTDLLVAICEDLVEGERDWRADKPLRSLSAQLTKEQAITHLEQLRGLGNAKFLEIRKRLRSETSAFREEVRALGTRALSAIAEAGLKDEDLYSGKTGPIAYFRALASFDDGLDEKKNTLKALEKDKWASEKAGPAERAAVEALAPLFRSTVLAGEHYRSTGALRRHALACAVLRDLLPSAALHLLDERLEAIKREEGVTFFSDLVKKVAAVVQREPAPFLFERLGERYRHFLIDEFQDTSLLQWQSLLPLITNALSTGGSALLVGDAKQAIYRWRNGEARQFTRLPSLFAKERMAEGDEHEAILERSYRPTPALTENYRSAREIIRFNNALFDALRETLPGTHRAVYRQQAQQEVKDHSGLVHVECFGPPRGEGDATDELPDAARFTLAAARSSIDDGWLPGEIAVLVRTKAQGRLIAEHLVGQGHRVVSPDGLTLESDTTVRAVIALLTWVLQPDEVSASKATQLLALADPGPDRHDALARPVQAMRNWMMEHTEVRARRPLIQLMHAIVRALKIHPAQNAFVTGMLNEAHLFVQEHGDQGPAFLEHWSRIASKRAVSAADDISAIRIMTVHASKGLQFPVVIVPFADMSARGPRDPVWIDPQGVAGELPAALVRPGKTLEALAIPELVEENELAHLDLMDLLYVAFTRPEQRLYAAFDGSRKTGPGADARAFLALAPGDVREWGAPDQAPPRKTQGPDSPLVDVPDVDRDGPLKLAIRQEAPEHWDPADPDPFRSHGKAMHAVLARVRVASDLDTAIRAEARAWGLRDDGAAMRERLAPLLARPELAIFFGPGLQVRTEATLIDRHGRAHRPDRITRDGSITRVLDIKTGVPAQDHHEQVASYMRLLRELGETEVTGHLLYVTDGTLVPVDQPRVEA